METVKIEGEKRDDFGTKFARSARNEGLIPCVLYGQDGVQHFTTSPNAVKHIVYTPDFKISQLHIDGQEVRAILKDIQFHPVTDQILHIDFLQLTKGVPVKVYIPLKMRGDAVGVKSGGRLIQQVKTVRVKTLPEHLVDELFVDVTDLKLGYSKRVRDIEHTDNIDILSPGATPVAMVDVPRALKSATAAEDDELEEGEEMDEEVEETTETAEA